MMGFYALYRLLWRPVIIAFYVLLAGIILLVLSAAGTDFPSLPEPGRLILLTLAFSSLAGFFVGQSVGEIQHTPLSWSIPRIRRRLVSSVGFTGAVIAVLTTWAYHWMGGSAPIIPILTSGFLWYSLTFTIGTYEFLDARSLWIRKSAVSFLAILIFVFGVLSINRITELYMSQPAICALVTLIVALLYLRRSFGVNAARGKSLVSMPLFHRFTFGTYKTSKLAARRNSRRRWKLTAPLTGLIDWIRAGEYENYGTVRVGLVGAFPHSVGFLVVVAVMVRIVGPDQVVGAVVTPVSVGLVMLQLSLYLKKGWLYPLSRVQLARLAYWSSLLHNALYCGIILLSFFLLEGLTGIFAGLDLSRPLLLMFICNPVIQWMRLRCVHMNISSYAILLAPFLIGYSILNAAWLGWVTDISFAYESAAVAGLILLSQGLFRYRVMTYYKKGDLV